jgi:AraC-like DNA-binding protein
MINSWRNRCLDNITYTSGDNFTHNFPDHFHEEYTIGVSVSGVQHFELQDKSFIVEPQSIFLIKPQVMHAHFPVADLGWSFKSLYLSPDLMGHLLRSTGVHNKGYTPILLQDKFLYAGYLRLHATRQVPDKTLLANFVNQLSTNANAIFELPDIIHPEKIEAIKCYLSDRREQKLHLDKIAEIYRIDKYQLIRQFRQYVGVTPNTYLTILRIEKARKMINTGYPVVEAALEAGFYDQSHFHHSFLYYTGVTPGKFISNQQ